MMKRDAAAIAGPAACSNCHSGDRWILHPVYHRNTVRYLCTACVLKLHWSEFCPICFSLHERPKKPVGAVAAAPPPPGLRGTLVCFKCGSVSHTSCVAPNTPKSPYLCPACSNPNVKLFDLRKSVENQIDHKSSRVFLAAARIADNSFADARERSRVEAERKARESVADRKKAKDDLEEVALAWMKEQEMMKLREGIGEAAEVSITVSSRNGLAVKAPSAVVVQMEKNGGTVVAGVRKKEGERVVPGRQVMVGSKESFKNGVQVENKVNNGMPSGSQHLQSVKSHENHGAKAGVVPQ